MNDTLLSQKQKNIIEKCLKKQDYKKIIAELDKISTNHAGTAKMKDKKYVINQTVKYLAELKLKNPEREFYKTGVKILALKSDNAKEIGVHIIRRGYKFNKKSVTNWLYKITDDPNWEVREYAAGALAATLSTHSGFYLTLRKWSNDKSENIRRGVVLSAAALRDKDDPGKIKRAFALLKPLLYDKSAYVKKNLGPFILGSYFGNAIPEEMFGFLDRIIKIKNENVRWNAAMVFNNSFGNRYSPEAVKYLKILAKDKNPTVQRAVKSTLNHLKKKNKKIRL